MKMPPTASKRVQVLILIQTWFWISDAQGAMLRRQNEGKHSFLFFGKENLLSQKMMFIWGKLKEKNDVFTGSNVKM